jgi:hypothetical protein
MNRPSKLQWAANFLSVQIPGGDQDSVCQILLKSKCADPSWTGIGSTSHELQIRKQHTRTDRQKPSNAIVEELKLTS